MIETLEIKNFRCFEQVKITELKTVNVLVGENASGKTALLEALYFTLGTPALHFKMRQWRGLSRQVHFNERTDSRNNMWRDLFYQFKQSLEVSIAFTGSADITRTVKILCKKNRTSKVSSDAQIEDLSPVYFEYYQKGTRTAQVYPIYQEGGVQLPNAPQPMKGAFFPSALPIDPQESATHFSELSKTNQSASVIREMSTLFPFIESLSLELNDLTPMVYARIRGENEMQPLGLISTGISKIFAFLVAIADQSGGVVIIDEIENGFHFSKLELLWDCLFRFSKEHNVQLFVSSHSEECLNAIKPILEKNPDDISLLRAVREQGVSTIKHFKGKDFLAALEENLDVR
jgi:AAA15 family ATPase/GTPase